MKRFLVALAVAVATLWTAGCAEQPDEHFSTVLAPLGEDDTEIEVSDEVVRDEEHRYVFAVPTDAEYVVVELKGDDTNGDADVYAKLNDTATQADYDCGPQLSGSDEVCLFLQGLDESELNITVRGFADVSAYDLTLLWQIDDNGDGIGTSP